MPWWGWALIVIGVAVGGWLKLSLFKKMAKNKAEKKKFKEEE